MACLSSREPAAEQRDSRRRAMEKFAWLLKGLMKELPQRTRFGRQQMSMDEEAVTLLEDVRHFLEKATVVVEWRGLHEEVQVPS